MPYSLIHRLGNHTQPATYTFYSYNHANIIREPLQEISFSPSQQHVAENPHPRRRRLLQRHGQRRQKCRRKLIGDTTFRELSDANIGKLSSTH